MQIVIETDNIFYEGWLSRVLQLFDRSHKPYPTDIANESWRVGWDTANETSEAGQLQALIAERELGRNLTISLARANKSPEPTLGLSVNEESR